MAVSETELLDHCVHCGLCLNACPTYRELGLEMDSPRGRIYQMVHVSNGNSGITPSYLEHIGLCLACRACETACPSGVQYGRLIEAARAGIERQRTKPWQERLLQWFVFDRLLPSAALLRVAAGLLAFYQRSGLQKFARGSGLLKEYGLDHVEMLSPGATLPTFFRNYGRVFPAEGERRYRVALLGGCIANVSFGDLHEATVRVLQKNGCEVHVPAEQTCCGALHVHSGLRDSARKLARRNLDAMLGKGYDAIITNAAGCGSTLKEYHELLEDDPRAKEFVALLKDINEFLAGVELNRSALRPLPYTVTYQDSCHLAHGQKIKAAPRELLKAIPGLRFRELPNADICCGSAGVYNVIHTDMAMAVLERKMDAVERVSPDVIATANPGCMLQLRAGARLYGRGERVAHVVELLDESYSAGL